MKIRRYIIAVITAAVCLCSCATKADIEAAQERLDNLRDNKLATVEEQLNRIGGTLETLQKTDANLRKIVKSLKEGQNTLQQQVEAAQDELESSIKEVKEYVDEKDKRDWITTTYATLELSGRVSTALGTLLQTLRDAEADYSTLEANANAAESQMKAWVNTQLSGIVTISSFEGQLSAMEKDFKGADSTMLVKITGLRSSLASLKTTIKSEYEAAISDAIELYEIDVTAKAARLAELAVGSYIDQLLDLEDKLEAIEDELDIIKSRTDELKNRIKVISLLDPDGAVVGTDGTSTMQFSLYPAPADDSDIPGFSFDVLYASTKAALPGEFSDTGIQTIDYSYEDGIVTYTVKFLNLDDSFYEGTLGAVARVHIIGLDNPVSTDYFPLITYAPIDLGLTSGIRWSQRNVGAARPEDYGGYYSWGEVAEKSNYSETYYEFYSRSTSTFDKYTTKSEYASYGIPDNLTTLEAKDDVASKLCNGDWRMATRTEWNELVSECTWAEKSLNGVAGLEGTGPNGKTIFFPYAGYKNMSFTSSKGTDCSYWTSSLYTSNNSSAYFFCKSAAVSAKSLDLFRTSRNCGLSIRPVWK